MMRYHAIFNVFVIILCLSLSTQWHDAQARPLLESVLSKTSDLVGGAGAAVGGLVGAVGNTLEGTSGVVSEALKPSNNGGGSSNPEPASTPAATPPAPPAPPASPAPAASPVPAEVPAPSPATTSTPASPASQQASGGGGGGGDETHQSPSSTNDQASSDNNHPAKQQTHSLSDKDAPSTSENRNAESGSTGVSALKEDNANSPINSNSPDSRVTDVTDGSEDEDVDEDEDGDGSPNNDSETYIWHGASGALIAVISTSAFIACVVIGIAVNYILRRRRAQREAAKESCPENDGWLSVEEIQQQQHERNRNRIPSTRNIDSHLAIRPLASSNRMLV
jgi:hypothetical protein